MIVLLFDRQLEKGFFFRRYDFLCYFFFFFPFLVIKARYYTDYYACPENLPASMREWLQNLHDEKQLLRPEQLAAAFVRIIAKGIPSSMLGKVIPWDTILEGLE
jgi:hypothetical protein